MALLSSILNSGSGNLIMPEIIASQVWIKRSTLADELADASLFWAVIDSSKTSRKWESVSLTPTADTTEQTIVDTTGEGLLTHIAASELSGSGTMTIRITIDGTLKTFISPTIGINTRFLMGAFELFATTEVAANGAGISSGFDGGYGAGELVTMTTSPQAIRAGGMGMIFKTSLKVTIQGSVNLTGTAERVKSAVSYSNYIPEGL